MVAGRATATAAEQTSRVAASGWGRSVGLGSPMTAVADSRHWSRVRLIDRDQPGADAAGMGQAPREA